MRRYNMKLKKCMALSVSAVMLFSFALTSCSALQNEDEKAVTAATEDFFEELKDAKSSKLAKLLSEDAAESEEALTLMAALDAEGDVADVFRDSLEKLSFKVKDVEASEDDEEGSVDVELTFVDVEAVLDDLDDDYDIDDLADAIEDAKTTKETITLEFIYDDDWLVDDLKDLTELIVDPFEDVSPAGAQDPNDDTDPSYYSGHWESEDGDYISNLSAGDTYVSFVCVTWEYFDGSTFTYEFTNSNGSVLFDGSYYVTDGSDHIYCNGNVSPLAEGTYTMNVYSPNGNLLQAVEIEAY